MKVGNTVNGLTVVDVKRVNKMNLIQFTKAVSEYIEQGYKIDVHSSRQIGLVLMVDMYKLESNIGEGVGYVGDISTGDVEVGSVGNNLKEEVVKEPNETTIKAIQETTEKLETVETIDDETEYLLSSESNKERLLESVERIKDKVVEGADDSSDQTEGVDIEQTTPPVKKTRTKKTT